MLCDGAGNLGLIIVGGDSYLLRRGTETRYNQDLLIEGTWSGGTTTMATFDNEPESFSWHDHAIEFAGAFWVIDPAPEEWTE